jgi:hypothetical protein
MKAAFHNPLAKFISERLKSAGHSVGLPASKQDLRLYALKNSLRDQRVFIVGSGPSLKMEHLDRIQGEISFSANMIYRSFQKTAWRPTFYVLGDLEVAKNYTREIVENVPSKLLLADFLAGYFPDLGRITTFRKEHECFEDTEPPFSSNPLQIVNGGYTVTYLMLQLAWWMGAREFHLLGVDCKWNLDDYKVVGQEGQIFQTVVLEKQASSYFIKDYFRPGETCIKPTHVKEQVLSMVAARKFIEGHGGKIFNAAKDSPLEVFERVDFDSLFWRV